MNTTDKNKNDYYYSTTPKEILEENNKHIVERWTELGEAYLKHSDEIAKLLFYINSGGVATLIGFMGASESVREVLLLQMALFLFALGLIFAILLRTFWIHQVKRISDGWQNDTKCYWDGEISFSKLLQNDNDRVKSDLPNFIVVYMSGISFVIGLGLGVFSLFTY